MNLSIEFFLFIKGLLIINIFEIIIVNSKRSNIFNFFLKLLFY